MQFFMHPCYFSSLALSMPLMPCLFSSDTSFDSSVRPLQGRSLHSCFSPLVVWFSGKRKLSLYQDQPIFLRYDVQCTAHHRQSMHGMEARKAGRSRRLAKSGIWIWANFISSDPYRKYGIPPKLTDTHGPSWGCIDFDFAERFFNFCEPNYFIIYGIMGRFPLDSWFLHESDAI